MSVLQMGHPRPTKTLVATWHKRDTCIALSHEAHLAVVHVAALHGWCGDGRDDGPKLSWSQLRSFC